MFLICLVLLPETLFSRAIESGGTSIDVSGEDQEGKTEHMVVQASEYYVAPPMTFGAYLNRIWLWDLERPPSRRLKPGDFVVKPLSMLRYPSVAFPAIY